MEQIVIDNSFLKSDLINIRGQKYPHISISKDNIVKPSIAPERYSEDIFIENDNSFWKRVFHQYRYKGFYPMLSFVKLFCDDDKIDRDESFNVGVKSFYWFAVVMLFLHSLYLRIYFYFFPFDKLTDDELINEFNCNLDWKNGLIRAFEWHPDSLRCAIALVNDLVYIYSADLHRPLNHICCLKNMAQKRISSIAWHPKRDDILAIASERKILLWFLQSDLQHFKPDVQKCLKVIDSKLSSPLTSIVFNSDGNTLIACSPRSSKLSVITLDWNNSEQQTNFYSIRLVRIYLTSPMTSLLWSPDKRRLLAQTTSNKIRIFENLQWSSKCWKSNLSSQCQTACWSRPSGRILLFAPKQSSKIYALTFYDKAEANDVGGSPDNSVLLLDTNADHFQDCQLGVHIQNIAWDRNSTRLAVAFRDKPEVIALFETHLSSSLQIWPLCTVSSKFGDNFAIPLLLKYHDYYVDNGCLLSICWSNGFVSHVSIPIDESSKKISDISSPRSLTSLCTSFSRANDSQVLQSPNNSIFSPNTSKPANVSKVVSPLASINTPRRTALFSTRVKFD